MNRIIEREFEISKLVRIMVFGRKKKKNNDQPKENEKKTEKKEKRAKRRSSIVSTPIRNRKSGKNGKKSSVRRNSLRRGRPNVMRKYESLSRKRAEKVVGVETRANPQGAAADSHRKEDGRMRIPIPPPPPPPPPPKVGITTKSDSGVLSKAKSESNETQGKQRVMGQYPEAQGKEKSVCVEMSRRERTPEDLRKWRQWRIGVNEQLVSYVTSDVVEKQSKASPVTSFPDDFTEDTIHAILNHSVKEEEPRTSLDKLSYMIYGIPRVNLRKAPKEKPVYKRHPIGKYILNSAYYKNVFAKSESESKEAAPLVSKPVKGRMPENLFIQTKTPSNIPRYLPPTAVKPGQRVKEKHKRVTSPIAIQTKDESKAKLQHFPRAQKTAYPEPHSPDQLCSRTKPPIPGAVPTILSGLQPYDMPRLRHVSIKDKDKRK